jgi:HAD superfamily hydrolase (TIGR01509 family)
MPALIFDYDGVIVDSESCAAHLAVELLAERGVEVRFHDLARFVGASRRDDNAFGTWLLELLGSESEAGAFDALLWERADVALQSLDVRPGVTALIEGARAGGWRVGIGSGQTRARVDAGLRRLRLYESFDAIVTGDDVAHGKPAPDIFLEAARRLGARPENCVVIEDSLPGCEAGMAAGMKLIACPCELTSLSEFPPAARVVGSLERIAIEDL